MRRAGVKERELWVTDWDNVEGGRDVAEVFGEMASFMKEMFDALPQMGEQGSFGDPTFQHMKEIGGFPIMTREFSGGAVASESTLKGAQTAAFDSSEFEPPKKYKRKDLMKEMKRK